MMRIALTGGIACGKSLVARYLNELGVETIDADDIVHELIPDPAERKRIAAEVFADPEKRRALEAKLHPLVKARIAAWLGEKTPLKVDASPKVEAVSRPLVKNGTSAFLTSGQETASTLGGTSNLVVRLAVVPLLFETHWDADYDIICCVRSARETQVARMTETRGYTREEAEARLAAQMPVEEKAAKSHYVIDNDGSAEELKLKVAGFVAWLKGRSTAVESNREQSVR